MNELKDKLLMNRSSNKSSGLLFTDEFDQMVIERAKQRNDSSVVSMPMSRRHKESLH
jgi:hypothetical protein